MLYLGYKITDYHVMPKLGINGRMISENLVVEHDFVLLHPIGNIRNPWKKVTKTKPTHCAQCNENWYLSGFVNPSEPQRFICDNCWCIISRMIEYFKFPHPLLKDLTKLEYLSNQHRDLSIIKFCIQEKRVLVRKNFLTTELLTKNEIPRELTPIINLFHLQKICRDNRVSMGYFK